VHQGPLEQHVILKEVELEHGLGLDDAGGVLADARDGLVVALGQERELPFQAAYDLSISNELAGCARA